MDAGVALAVALALLFAFTNGVQDSANSIATLIATRAGRPGPALVMATVAIFAGPFLLGSAVADIGRDRRRRARRDGRGGDGRAHRGALRLLGTGRRGTRGSPSSSSHALIGGLVQTGDSGRWHRCRQLGRLDGLRPVGVVGIVVVLATSSAIRGR